MERICLIYYKGREILSTDYRGLLDDEELFAFAEEIIQYQLHLNRPTLQLTNIEGIFFTPKLMECLKTLTPKVQHLIKKDAILGITGAKRILFQVYNALIGGNAKAFKDEQTAKDWLVQD